MAQIRPFPLSGYDRTGGLVVEVTIRTFQPDILKHLLEDDTRYMRRK